MRREGVRLLGALVVVIVAAVLAARYAMRPGARAGSRDAAASPSAAPPVATMRLETVVSGARIYGLSSGADAALAVGDGGRILRLGAGEKMWSDMSSPTKAALRAVAQQLDGAVAVGDDGTILELAAGAWKAAASPTKQTLRAVVYSSYGAIAVGDGGAVVRRAAPGEPWRAEASGTSADLLGACAGLRDVWVVGRAGAMASRSFEGWKLHASITASTLRAAACDDRAGIAVGQGGVVLQRQDGADWHEAPSGTKSDLLAVAAPVGTRSWLVVGAHGAVVRVAGEAVVLPATTTWDLRAVTDGPLGTWIAGDDGIARAH